VNVAQAVGESLARLGVRTAFGVVGSGNFHVANALTAGGARFVAARHEGGAAVMADAYSRVTGDLGVLCVHQGPGLTNAMTGITEAAKSRTPMLILAAEATAPRSNFYIDQGGLAVAVGAVPGRVSSAATAATDLALAHHIAVTERRTVLLNLPLDVQAADAPEPFILPEYPQAALPAADREATSALADALAAAERPVFIAGRGARHAGPALRALAMSAGALLATSAVAKGLFHGDPFNLDVSGGFATPAAAELIRNADLLVGWGCSLNMWTLRHGALIADDTTVVQIDLDSAALGAHGPVDLGIVGDVAMTAQAVADELTRRGYQAPGYRSAKVAERLAREGRWRDVPYQEYAEPGRIDPRALSAALDEILPAERAVAVDSGNFMGYPAMYLDVPDPESFVFTQAFQSIGLGLATAVGTAVARPDRLTVAALGDGGALMGINELETVVRLGLDLLVVVYDDEAYSAEVHHFRPGGYPLDHVRFPPVDLAAIGRGFGCEGVTVSGPDDLAAVREWVAGPRERPMIVDAKVKRTEPSWWLDEAFRGH
jgi:thiamine pyrophosphate-dependent acetolactate synthase large subunit-like protein